MTIEQATTERLLWPAKINWPAVAQWLFFALLVRPFLFLFIGCRVRGKEHLPSSGPFILIANHSSHFDTLALLCLFPLHRLRTIRPVAAADYFTRNWFIEWASHTFFNILPIARQGIRAENNPLPAMLAQLRAGNALLVFPEGTRGDGSEIGPFRSGIAHVLAELPDTPVVPAYLLNLNRCLPKGAWLPAPLFCEIRVGAPRVVKGNRPEVLQALREAVRALKPGAD